MIPLLRDRYPFYDPKHHPKQINTLHTTRSSFLPTFRTKRNPIFSTFYTRGEKALKRAIRNLLRADRRKIVIPERERERREWKKWTLVLTPFAKVKGRWRGREGCWRQIFAKGRFNQKPNILFQFRGNRSTPRSGWNSLCHTAPVSRAHTRIHAYIYAHR